jgi:hypothetical protein
MDIKILLILCVVLLGLITERIYYPTEKTNSPYEEYRYNLDKAWAEKQHKELEKARQYKQYSDNLVHAHKKIIGKLKAEIEALEIELRSTE